MKNILSEQQGGVRLEDDKIIELFWNRSEQALEETKKKYCNYCHTIAFGILRCSEDAEECVNESLMSIWNAIPPARPAVLRTFLGKITRNISLNLLEKKNAKKRGANHISLAMSELEECVSCSDPQPGQHIEDEVITQAVNNFLRKLKSEQQKVFVRRYWYANSIEEIACDYNLSQSKVKSILFRLRKKLKAEMEKEGISL